MPAGHTGRRFFLPERDARHNFGANPASRNLDATLHMQLTRHKAGNLSVFRWPVGLPARVARSPICTDADR